MVRMSDEAARHVENRFDNLSNEFSETRDQVTTQAAWLELGCGQFTGEIGEGKATFELGWRDLLETGRISAGLIAGNTNALHVDLNRLDQDYGHEFDLFGGSTAPPPGTDPRIPEGM